MGEKAEHKNKWDKVKNPGFGISYEEGKRGSPEWKDTPSLSFPNKKMPPAMTKNPSGPYIPVVLG